MHEHRPRPRSAKAAVPDFIPLERRPRPRSAKATVPDLSHSQGHARFSYRVRNQVAGSRADSKTETETRNVWATRINEACARSGRGGSPEIEASPPGTQDVKQFLCNLLEKSLPWMPPEASPEREKMNETKPNTPSFLLGDALEGGTWK